MLKKRHFYIVQYFLLFQAILFITILKINFVDKTEYNTSSLVFVLLVWSQYEKFNESTVLK